jgi:hypothetical protein
MILYPKVSINMIPSVHPELSRFYSQECWGFLGSNSPNCSEPKRWKVWACALSGQLLPDAWARRLQNYEYSENTTNPDAQMCLNCPGKARISPAMCPMPCAIESQVLRPGKEKGVLE